jgi:hypothetical protein
VSFAQTNAAQIEKVDAILDKSEAKVVLHLEAVNLGGPIPAELLQGFDDGEAGEANAILRGAVASHVHFTLREVCQVVDVGPRLVGSLGRHLRVVLGDEGQLEVA